MMPRSVLMTLVVSAVVLIPVGMVNAAPRDDGPRRDLAGPVSPPVAPGLSNQGDRNGDRISDDFEARLRGAGAAERLAVIVTGFDSATAQRAVGPFSLTHELPLIDGFAATLTAGQARGLSHHPGLRRIEEDGVVGILDDATNADFGATAARANTQGLDGSGVGICVIDTGIDPAHEQLAGRPVVFKDFVNNRLGAYDDHGHGTHVMSIASGDGIAADGSSEATTTQAATFVGVAPAANLYAAKVLDSSGSGSDSDVVAGIQWCNVQLGVDVISLSLGGGGGNGTDATSVAVNNAVAGGDVVVVAAGNSGDEPGTINAPGVATGAITVGAVSDYSAPVGTARRDDGIWLAGFSSRGPTLDRRMKPDIAAPGVTVTSADAGTTSGYVTMSGTSMATPYVSGAVALALEADLTATPTEIKTALATTALDVGAPGPDNDWGAGLIDVRAFVDTVAGVPEVRTTGYPTLQHVDGMVPANPGYADILIPVAENALGLPIAATVTLAGEPVCSFGCLIVEWAPDLDMELRAPNGAVVAVSECTLAGLFCGIGRQETIGFRPTTAGTYVLRVYAFTAGDGGPFSADIFRGPLTTSTPTPPPDPPANVAPDANAGPDQSVKVNRKTKLATFTLNASGSTDSDGTIASYAWRQGISQPVGTGATLTLSRSVGSYTFTVTVTDDDDATGQDSVVVTVRR